MLTMKVSTLRSAPAFAAPARCARPARQAGLRVVAETRWALVPKKGSAKSPIDLTGEIGKKDFYTLGSKADHADTDKALEALGKGVHVAFEAKGGSGSLNSPAGLYVKDLGSEVEITADGTKLEKDKEVPLKPGSKVAFGSDVVFEVNRDAKAHA